MKKGKVFKKGQIFAVLMVLALGAAVWLNLRFTSGEKYLGQATYVSKTKTADKAVATAAKTKVTDEDAFEIAVRERETLYQKTEKKVAELLDSEKLTDDDKAQAVSQTAAMAKRMEQAGRIETLLKAKGFAKAVAVIGENSIRIVVQSDGLTAAQTLQIQEIATAETELDLSTVRILAVKK